VLAAERARLDGEIAAARTLAEAAAAELAAAERAAAAAEARHAERIEALGRAREERARAEAGREQAEEALADAAARISETFDCAPDVLGERLGALADAALGPDETEAALDRLKRNREAIGAVNLMAEAEMADIAAELAAIEAQGADLRAAVQRLRQAIRELNHEGRERLLAAFAEVDRHFQDLFVKLFGGGRAHLELTEAEDPLEAGLEIMASPPGKKLQVLSLLSGGERALTALALVFAMFLTNPAPICVLDEVDAPLDDANVERFCDLVRAIARRTATRFLIITHHRVTMARMDRLYGVTMMERGVSRLVSVELREAELLRESA
jgi:chromosome segregation protein